MRVLVYYSQLLFILRYVKINDLAFELLRGVREVKTIA
jgi:hypothetical protein